MAQSLTEQRNTRSMNIDQLSTLDMLSIINDEDATVAQVVRKAMPQIAQAVDAIASGIANGGRLIYVGAGSSGRLGVLDAAECHPTYSAPPEMVQALMAGGRSAMFEAVEGAEDDTEAGRNEVLALRPTPHDVIVGIAASGRTPYVLGALAAANEAGSTTVGIACNETGSVLDAAQIKIALPVGPEVITGSTRMKAGTAQKLALNMISTGSMVKMGKVYGNLMVDMVSSNIKLVGRARRVVCEIAGISEDEAEELLAQCNREMKTAIVMSRKKVSVEAARKLLNDAKGNLRTVIG